MKTRPGITSFCEPLVLFLLFIKCNYIWKNWSIKTETIEGKTTNKIFWICPKSGPKFPLTFTFVICVFGHLRFVRWVVHVILWLVTVGYTVNNYYLTFYIQWEYSNTYIHLIIKRKRVVIPLTGLGARVAQWVRSLDLMTHTSLSPIWRGFAPAFVNYKPEAPRRL